ncbi:hypothetical protein [Iodidimonas nitroreducens]|nr:hypothetical protein [Iodidimonas nitroreducens]
MNEAERNVAMPVKRRNGKSRLSCLIAGAFVVVSAFPAIAQKGQSNEAQQEMRSQPEKMKANMADMRKAMNARHKEERKIMKGASTDERKAMEERHQRERAEMMDKADLSGKADKAEKVGKAKISKIEKEKAEKDMPKKARGAKKIEPPKFRN